MVHSDTACMEARSRDQGQGPLKSQLLAIHTNFTETLDLPWDVEMGFKINLLIYISVYIHIYQYIYTHIHTHTHTHTNILCIIHSV